MRYIYIFLSVYLFTGCASKEVLHVEDSKVVELNTTKEPPKQQEIVVANTDTHLSSIKTDKEPKAIIIKDLERIPQDVSHYLQDIKDTQKLYKVQKKYEKYYFRTWNMKKPDEKLKEAMWPFGSYKFGKNYGENFQLLKKEFFQSMLESANFKKYATKNLYGVTLKETNIRAFPTIKPVLNDPSLAGEGFPFDYMQNSTIHANKPILISHYSKDKAWAFIFSSFTSGWIKVSEFVVIDKKYTDTWQKAKQVRIIKEGVPIYKQDGSYLFESKIGMMFALIDEDENFYTILTVSSYNNSQPLYNKSKISKGIATKSVLTLNKTNLKNIINEVSKTNYGWGGMYEQRDCSSMLRDMYAPFGIWLPRNSYQQSLVGKVNSLSKFTNDKKIKFIKEKASPFKTLLYKKGHIVLYVGTYEGEIVVFHNTWGVKTIKDGVEGRVVIGRPIFSTLNLGSNLEDYDKDAGILKNLKSMNTLTN